MADIIFEDAARSLVIRSQRAPDGAMTDLVARTVWGSGGTRYQIRDTQHKLDLLRGADFLGLKHRGRLIGAYVLRGKSVTLGSQTYPAYYRTYLAVDADAQGHGYGSLLVEAARRHYSKKIGAQGILYGYIEADNERSLGASRRARHQSIATFHTAVFSRFGPRAHPAVRRLDADRRQEQVAALDALYADHGLRDFDQSLDPTRYLVYEGSVGIEAGIQIETCDWVIKHLPGATGWALVNLVSRTPGLRRLFNAHECRFLKFGNLFARPGREELLFQVMETALARHGVGSAMIFHDPRSPVFQRIAAAGSFGLLNSNIDASVHVMAALIGCSEAEVAAIKEQPVVLSPLDVG